MPSVKNPNFTSKNRVAVRAAKLKAQRRKQSDAGRAAAVLGAAALAKTDLRRGARPGLLPTSGPNRALSRKKARKLEKQMAHALKRKMAAEGEVDMKDAPAGKSTNGEKMAKTRQAQAEVDVEMDVE